jgi:hypothetical protein
VSALCNALFTYHSDEVAIPVNSLVALFVVEFKARNIFAPDGSQVAVVGTYGVFYLPHIEKVTYNVVFSQLLGNKHN